MEPLHHRLNEKEREILALILEGHSVKSAARLLDVSANTLNERLRSARRKMGVASSREAALKLRDHAEHPYKLPVTNEIGMGSFQSSHASFPLPGSPGADDPEMELATVQADYIPLSTGWVPSSGLPLRKEGMRNNGLSRSERLRIFRELTLAMATSFALISLAFILISTLLRHR